MKHLVPCIVLVAAVLGQIENRRWSNSNGFFLGPTAVGLGAGAVSYRRGHSLGYSLGQSRTYSRGGNSYNSYSRSNHYHQTNNYYSHYTQPKSVRSAKNLKNKPKYLRLRLSYEVCSERPKRFLRGIRAKKIKIESSRQVRTGRTNARTQILTP